MITLLLLALLGATHGQTPADLRYPPAKNQDGEDQEARCILTAGVAMGPKVDNGDVVQRNATECFKTCRDDLDAVGMTLDGTTCDFGTANGNNECGCQCTYDMRWIAPDVAHPNKRSCFLTFPVKYEAKAAPAGVWVVMGLYLVFLVGVAAHSYIDNKQKEAKYASGELTRTTTRLEDHYIGGRDLGPWALALTLLASTWSGYTVVGAPEDTYKKGWNATRYMGGFVITQSTMLLMCARLQWYAFKRRYVGTVDFVTDRFRSHFARIFVTGVQLFASVLYVVGQFSAIGSTAEGMSNGAIPSLLAAIFMCVLMLGYEALGGMKAIALTDLVQGLILMVGCVLYFPLMESVFEGGITETTEQLRACAQAYDVYKDTYDPVADPMMGSYGCMMDGVAVNTFDSEGIPIEPQYGAQDAWNLLTITEPDVSLWLPFYVAGISFPVYPQILVRFYTARKVSHLQWGMQLTHLSVFYLCLPAFLTGYTILSRNIEGLDRTNTNQAFARIMNEAMNYNTFFYITGCCTVSAAMAAYMSTADSALMAASSAITLEYLPYFLPTCTGKQIEAGEDIRKTHENLLYYVAKVTSVFFGALAVIMSQVDIALTDLYIIQGGALMLGCPAYFFGMYSKKVTALAINISIGVSLLCFILFFAAADKDGTLGKLPEFWATVINIGLMSIFTWGPIAKMANMAYYGKEDPYDPEEYPVFLTYDTVLPREAVGVDIREGGGPLAEPIRPLWVNFIVFLLLFLAIPFWVNLPTTYLESSFSGAMPTWAVCSTFFAAIAMLINIFQTYYNWEDWIQAEINFNGGPATVDLPESDPRKYDKHKIYKRFVNGRVLPDKAPVDGGAETEMQKTKSFEAGSPGTPRTEL